MSDDVNPSTRSKTGKPKSGLFKRSKAASAGTDSAQAEAAETNAAETEAAETGQAKTGQAKTKAAGTAPDAEVTGGESPGTAVAEGDSAPDLTAKSAPQDRDVDGPLDESEANPVRPYVDLGGVKILPREGLHLRLEIEEGSKRVVAIGLDYAGSTLQVQPFAAPRSSGLWNEIRTQIADRLHHATRRSLRPGTRRRDPRRSRPGPQRHHPSGPLHRRRRPALVPARRHRRRGRHRPGRRGRHRGPLPQHRRRARCVTDASARPYPAADAGHTGRQRRVDRRLTGHS
jgi:hypothetical protein